MFSLSELETPTVVSTNLARSLVSASLSPTYLPRRNALWCHLQSILLKSRVMAISSLSLASAVPSSLLLPFVLMREVSQLLGLHEAVSMKTNIAKYLRQDFYPVKA